MKADAAARRQACPPPTIPWDGAAHGPGGTAVCWLGSAGVLVQSRGTALLIDPVLSAAPDARGVWRSEAGGMALLRRPPASPEQLAFADAVLYTHADEDHMGRETARRLGALGLRFHGPAFVTWELARMGLPPAQLFSHPSHDVFSVGCIRVRMTGASHGWQESMPGQYDWKYGPEDCAGFWLDTPDGAVWDPGDSRLLEEHLRQPPADLLLMDFSDDPYHFGRSGALRLAESQPDARLLMFHWGTFSENRACYAADPAEVRPLLKLPDRLLVPAMGQRIALCASAIPAPP